MSLNFTRLVLAALFIFSGLAMPAQKSKAPKKEYPASFSITKAEFDQLLAKKPKETLSDKSNKYLDKGSVLMNTKNGDMQFVKLKLNYFPNAYLVAQVNGAHSTQVFVMSDDKSVFYKGKQEHGDLVMSKCTEDEIVSE